MLEKMLFAITCWLIIASGAEAQWWGESGRSVTHQGSDYGTTDARRPQQIQTGTVEDLRVVRISRRGEAGQYVGAGVGGALGAIAGRAAVKKSGDGRNAASVLLGALGAYAGHHVGESLSEREELSVEVIVALDNGNVVGITQAIDEDARELRPGDRVRLVQGSVTRVVRMRHQGRVITAHQ